MRKMMFPLLATASFAIAGLAGVTMSAPANAADLYVGPQPRAHVQYDYVPADRYSYRTVEIYEEPTAVYYDDDDDYAPPPVVYRRPVPPAPVVEYDYAPRDYHRGYAPAPRAIRVFDAD